MTGDDVLNMLMKGGPWTVVLGLSYVVRAMWHHIQTRERAFEERTQALNDRIIAAVEKQLLLIQSSNDQRRELVRLLKPKNDEE